jgi:hypothetical protein
VTVKTAVSRFQIHDELTAPDESAPLIKSIQAAGGAVTKFVGVLAGAPAVLRAYTRMRSELRGGVLPQATRERRAGLGLDEVSKARSFTSADPKEAALLAFLKEALAAEGPPPLHLHEEAREIGWTDEEILEAVAHLALNEFQSLIASAAALPQDQGGPRALPSAA